MKDRRMLRAVVALAVVLPVSLCLAEGIEAISRPSEDVTLSFPRAGKLAKVLIKDGEVVKSGQLVIQMEDDAEQAQLAQLKSQADDTTHCRAAQAQLDQKKVDLKKTEWANQRNAATDLEVEHAKLEVVIADLSLELARFQQEQDKKKYEEARLQVERLKLISPVSGKVEKVTLQAGETADAQEHLVRLVKTDPLWIDVPVPVAEGRKLKVSDPAYIEFPGEDKPATGKVIFIAAVADAASDTLPVRVEAPNASLRPAGEHVKVSFAAAGPKAGKDDKAVATTQPQKKEKE